jgi:hypothetical protein
LASIRLFTRHSTVAAGSYIRFYIGDNEATARRDPASPFNVCP